LLFVVVPKPPDRILKGEKPADSTGRNSTPRSRLESSPEQVAIERRARAAWLIIG
jgi:hypothetical protein